MAETTIIAPRTAATAVQQRAGLLWISALRVVAAVAVVLLHTAHYFVAEWANIVPLNWWIANAFESTMHWYVPVFVLVSGSLLLNPSRNEDAITFARKRAARILAPLLFWSALYLAWRIFVDRMPTNDIRQVLLEGIPFYHLWYLYMIPGLYLFTPFLRTYVRSSSDHERAYLVVLLLLLAAVNAYVSYFVRPDTQSIFSLFVPYLAYYLAGYQLTIAARRVRTVWLVVVLAASTVLSVVVTSTLVHQYGDTSKGLYGYDYFSVPVMSASLVIFLLVRRMAGEPRRVPAPLAALINRVDPATLGIYVVHPLILAILSHYFGFDPAHDSPLLAIPLIAALAVCASYLLTELLMHIPLLRQTVV